MKLQQFLALPIGTELKGFKKRFVVKSRDVMDGIEQPSLIDLDTQEPLFGAIYIPHLLSLDGQASSRDEDAPQDEPQAEVGQDAGMEGSCEVEPLPLAEAEALPAPDMKVEPPFDPMADVDDYTRVSPAFVSDDACVMAVNAEMIKHQPNATQYAEMLKAL